MFFLKLKRMDPKDLEKYALDIVYTYKKPRILIYIGRSSRPRDVGVMMIVLGEIHAKIMLFGEKH